MLSKKFFLILLYVLALAGVSFYLNHKSIIGIDDANIYFVYMRNFAEGHGFVYNIGGERVEGFTSLLWTLIGAFFYLFTENPEIFFIAITIVLLSFNLLQVCQYLDQENSKKFSFKSLFFLALIGATPGFVDWTVLSLMESGLWCLLLTNITLQILNNKSENSNSKFRAKFGLTIILLLLCRPESLLLVPLFICLNTFKDFSNENNLKKCIQKNIFSIIIFVLTSIFIFSWRYSYFSYFFPNTFYAKVSFSLVDNIQNGFNYICLVYQQKPYLLFIVFFSIYSLYKSKKSKNSNFSSLFILLSITLTSFLIPILTGGDHFGMARVIMPFLPIILLLFIHSLNKEILENKVTLIFIVLTFYFSNSYNIKEIYLTKDYPIRHEWEIAINDRENSEKLNLFFKNNKLPSQGVYRAGASAYKYEGETIDLLGLNNTKIAHAQKNKNKNLPKNHASFDKAMFYNLSPDILWFDNSGFVDISTKIPKTKIINTHTFANSIFQKIYFEERFKNSYGLYAILKKNQKIYLQIFASHKFVAQLNKNIYSVEKIKYE